MLPSPADGNDVFELESASPADSSGSSTSSNSSSSSSNSSLARNPDVVVTIRGSSPLALATGLGWYLRYYCKAYPGSWDNRRVDGQATGRQLATINPDRLPRVSPALRRHSAVEWRYCKSQ